MPDPVITSAAAPVVAATTPTNGTVQDQPFGNQMEELLQQAFADARKDQFKAEKPAAVRDVPADKVEDQESSPESAQRTQPAVKPDKPTAAPDVKTTPRAAQWKEVNEERERLRKENEAFKAEKEKWKGWETERSLYDTTKKTNEELLSRIQAIAVEKDPRFENYFKGKTDTAIALAKQAVGDTHAERVAKLLQLPDSDFRTNQLEEVMAELGPTRQSRLGAAIVEMDRIHLEKHTAISKSKENWEAMQAADRAEEQKSSQTLERAFQDRLGQWSDPAKGIPLFQKKDGDEAHNAEIKQRIDYARQIINNNLDADQLSKAALWAASAPGLLKTLMATSEELKTVKAENEALKAGGPDLKIGDQEAPQDDAKQYAGLSYGEIIAEKARKEGAWR